MNTTNTAVKFTDNVDSEIIDDAGLIDCINKLNSLRESGSETISTSEKIKLKQEEEDTLTKIHRIGAEMRWFSQWLTAKMKSAA